MDMQEVKQLTAAEKLALRLNKLPNGMTSLWVMVKGGEIVDYGVSPVSKPEANNTWWADNFEELGN